MAGKLATGGETGVVTGVVTGACAWTGGPDIRAVGVAEFIDGDAQPEPKITMPDSVRINCVNESRIAAVRWFAKSGGGYCWGAGNCGAGAGVSGFTIGAHAGEPKKKRGNKAGDLGGATLPIRTTATGRPNRSATSKASW